MKKIAIVGAGISGLFLANLLEQDQSYSYKIFEKKTSLKLNDGYGIQLSVNSINLLNKIGFQKINSVDLYFPKKVNFFDTKTSTLGSILAKVPTAPEIAHVETSSIAFSNLFLFLLNSS